jgi:hypothetical protein
MNTTVTPSVTHTMPTGGSTNTNRMNWPVTFSVHFSSKHSCLTSIDQGWQTGTCPQVQTMNNTECLCYMTVEYGKCYQQCPGDPNAPTSKVQPEITSSCKAAGLHPLALPPAPWAQNADLGWIEYIASCRIERYRDSDFAIKCIECRDGYGAICHVVVVCKFELYVPFFPMSL